MPPGRPAIPRLNTDASVRTLISRGRRLVALGAQVAYALADDLALGGGLVGAVLHDEAADLFLGARQRAGLGLLEDGGGRVGWTL